MLRTWMNLENILLSQGSPTPGPQTSTDPWPLRNWKEVSGGQASETSSVLTVPITHITTWALPPVRSSEVLDSQRSVNPTVNWACEGSNLQDPYENLMLDDLILLNHDELHGSFIIYHSVITIKCTINVMCFNHSKIIPPPPPTSSVQKLSSMKPVPRAKKVGDHCFMWKMSYTKLTYCRIPFIGNVQKRHISIETERRLVMVVKGMMAKGHRVSFTGWWKHSGISGNGCTILE